METLSRALTPGKAFDIPLKLRMILSIYKQTPNKEEGAFTPSLIDL